MYSPMVNRNLKRSVKLPGHTPALSPFLPPNVRQGDRIWLFARAEYAPRPSRRPLRGLLRMRLSGIGARQNDGRTLGPHPEGPPTAGLSHDTHNANPSPMA